MKTTIFFILIVISIQYIMAQDDTIHTYIYEYGGKIYGKSLLGFIITKKDDVIRDVCFKILYNKNSITRVLKMEQGVFDSNFVKKGNGVILVKKKERYSNHRFKNHSIMNEEFYKLISPTFLDVTNEERMLLLEKLCRNTN